MLLSVLMHIAAIVLSGIAWTAETLAAAVHSVVTRLENKK